MEIGGLYPAVLSLVLIGILLGVGLSVLGSLGQTTTGTAGTSVNDTLTSISNLTTWIPIIVVVVAAAVIITLVIRSFTRG